MSDHTSVELAQLRAELHATNRNVERIANAVERTLGDHEQRLRSLEATDTGAKTLVKLGSFIGFPTLCLLIYLVASKVH